MLTTLLASLAKSSRRRRRWGRMRKRRKRRRRRRTSQRFILLGRQLFNTNIFSQFFLWRGNFVIRILAYDRVTKSILINQKTTDV